MLRPMLRPMLRRPRLASPSLLALMICLSMGVARAALSDAVVAAFRGKLVLTRAAVPEGANDKETIARLKAAQLTEIVGASTDDGEVWRYHYAAFLKKTGNVGLKVRYVSGEQDRRPRSPRPRFPSPTCRAPCSRATSRSASGRASSAARPTCCSS